MTAAPLAVVTGASTGIGYELAKCCAEDGYDLIVCAHEEEIYEAADKLGRLGTKVEAVKADLSTEDGVAALWDKIGDRDVDALLANAGRTLGGGFLDQRLDDWRNLVDLNISGTLSLIHKVGNRMRARDQGRILITGSIAGRIPGPFMAVYNGTKAFLESFSYALRNELKDTNVTVTCLAPGPTETEVFKRGDMEDSPMGSSEMKDDPAMVARSGYEAMKDGNAEVASGLMNKVQTAFAGIVPDTLLAEMHRHLAKPKKAD
ncbi:putative short chain oxidoreductase protein [Fulvimarina pelagi HTCC2506]|uniref:Putative short chain oxidoreductase protein n=1 Tax=Fulvimarina pelagi HTCC2506 TaxID=314231 RepID=Q0FY38_9HYPH|nr:SDR family NAD(P)-dependent oxidoreductase [Fulvimarina pelagi]EAU39904.1 putative short chain oxidoreductase protein [Fulvimarina pelagi HTCC2506]